MKSICCLSILITITVSLISAFAIDLFGFDLNQTAASGRFHTKQGYRLSSRTLVQPVDHRNPAGEKFEQEILILDPDGIPRDSAVFFILGNETDATHEDLVKMYRAYGAPENVIFINAEHRGYGQSVTTAKDQSRPDYVRIHQALADYHRVVMSLKEEYPGPWMAAGYSYGGGLVINFAHRYPGDVRVVLASSAVIDWPFYMAEYDRQVKLNLGDALYRRLAGHVRKLKPKDLFDETWVERELLTTLSIGMSQYKRHRILVPVIRVISWLPTRSFVNALRRLDHLLIQEAGWTAARSFGKEGLSREEAVTGVFNWYTWKYQQCHETGTFWVSENPDGLFPKSHRDIQDECRAMFGIDPPAAVNPPWNPRGMIPGLSVPLVFVVGGMDPWKGLCLEPESAKNAGNYFFIPDGYHCPDRDDPELGKRILTRMMGLINGE